MPAPDTVPATAADRETLARPDGATIAYHRLPGAAPGIVFLGGLRSDMTGTKALFLEEYCRRRGRAYLRFDYFGHGASSGDFALGTIGRWRDDAAAVIDSLTKGPQILVGSSMGGWIMLLAALARPERIAALIEDGAQHLLLGAPIPIDMPVRLLHGLADASVPWQLSLRLAERLTSRDIAVILVKGGDHRLSSEPDLARLGQTLDALL